MITSFVDWLVNIIESFGYIGVALSMFIESFFAPIPSEIILPFSGFVASNGSLNIYIVILVAIVSAYLGTLPFYFIGYLGEEKVYSFLDKYGKYFFISKDNLEKGYTVFEKYGNIFVLLGRVVPIIRSVISFPAGVSRMNFGVFTLYTLLGTAVWSSLLATAGYFLGEKWDIVSVYINKYEKGVIVVILVLVVLYIVKGIRDIKKKEVK